MNKRSFIQLLKKTSPSNESSIKGLNKWNYSQRVRFINLSFDYLDDMHAYSTNPKFYRFFEYDSFKTKKETREYLQKLMDRETNGYFGGLVKYWFLQEIKTKKVIGTVGLCGIDTRRRSAELTIGISPDYSQNGFFFEAQFQIIEFCFKTLDLHRLTSLTNCDNTGLIQFEKQCGYTQEGIFRDYYLMQNNIRKDAILTGILSGEFKFDHCILLAKLAQGSS
jgi:[ribosomal protein S5]-alanine N-acetyltransferase